MNEPLLWDDTRWDCYPTENWEDGLWALREEIDAAFARLERGEPGYWTDLCTFEAHDGDLAILAWSDT